MWPFTHNVAQVAAPAAMGLAVLFAGQVGGGIMLLGLAALGALAFYLWCGPAPCRMLMITPAAYNGCLHPHIAARLPSQIYGVCSNETCKRLSLSCGLSSV